MPFPAIRHLLRRLLPPPSPFSRSLSSSGDLSHSISVNPSHSISVNPSHSISGDLSPTISGDLSPTISGEVPNFSLQFSDIPTITTSSLQSILNNSPSLGRHAISLLRWLILHRNFTPDDESLSHIVHYLGRRRDFKAVHALLLDHRRVAARHSLHAAVDRLARAGRASQAVHLFDCLEKDFGFKPDASSLSFLVACLCRNGFSGHAERAVKRMADLIFPTEEICCALVKGYGDELKLEDCRRLMGEIRRGGFEVGAKGYNCVIDCVCRLCRRKDPILMIGEAQKLLFEMESMGVARDQETFHVVIYNLCKIRKSGDAMRLFREMSGWGCSPGGETYLVLIRSLYQAARLSEAEEMIGFMRSAGFGGLLDRKAYYGFIKILCGIERVEHAMKVFRKMKSYGHVPGIKTYELLIGKLASHNEVNWANGLFKEAVAKGVPVVSKVYRVEPRYAKVKKEKKEKTRETLPEKMKRKRRRLKKLRLSFVKKPKSTRRFV